MASDERLIPLQEAARRAGVSNTVMKRIIRENGCQVYRNPADRRQKLVDMNEIEAAMRPRRLEEDSRRSAQS